MKQTAHTLHQRGHGITIVGTKGRGDGQPEGWAGETQAFRRYGPYSLHYAPGLSRWLNHQPARWDVASMQSVWLHTNHVVADWCIRHDRPFMITSHGNFNPVALRISAWKKALARRTFMRRVFEQVACYQASTEIEYRTLREQGIRKPICIIGNAIEAPDVSRMPPPESLLPPELLRRRTCLYLGRLFPIKGIDRLLRAWAKVRPTDDWQLVIAGDGSTAYRAELERIAHLSGCLNVHFIGFVPTEVKFAWLRQAECLVLPSHSEAFAMAPMEAFSYGTPALLTTGCAFPEAAQAGAALEVVSSEAGLCEGLVQLQALSQAELETMGARAQAFVRERYDGGIICAHLEAVYDWMSGASRVPDCLRLD